METIEQVIFAEDANRQPLHPTLRGSWEWIETSGYVIYVETSAAMAAVTLKEWKKLWEELTARKPERLKRTSAFKRAESKHLILPETDNYQAGRK